MSNKEIVLLDKEKDFIDLIIRYRGNVQKAAEEAGYASLYGYALRKRLAKYIAEATQEFIAMESIRAAHVVLDNMDKEFPNPIHLAAAKDILDRAGVKAAKEEEEKAVIRANIFILPEKRPLEAIDVSYTEVK